MDKIIPLSVPNLRGNELEYVTHAVKTEWVSTAGPYITDFENKMKDYVKSRGAVACQSGTSGIHLALQACGVGPQHEVLVPTLTFIAAVNPVKYIGATPIFMDCDDSLTMDMNKVKHFCEEECIFEEGKLIDKISGKIVKAMVVVHVFGNMAEMETAMKLSQKYGLKIIEDATEALGTYYTDGIYKGRFAGTIGDIGIYSFNGNKIITTGGGGMIVSNNEKYLDKCRHLSTQAKADVVYFDHDEIGYNYRMTNLQAALGLAQLEQLEDFIRTKEENYRRYQANGMKLLEFRSGIRSNKWFYSLVTERRDELITYLSEKGIQTRPIWKLIHTLKPYCGVRTYQIQKAEEYYAKIVNIPCSTNLTIDEVDAVCSAINEFKIG